MTKVAVIGIGKMGAQHARIYDSIKNVSLVGLADLDEKKGGELSQKYKTKFYNNYETLLINEKPDAISIAVPTEEHAKVSVNSMKIVNKILIEKPLAQNLNNAKYILKNAKKYKCIVKTGYVERYNPVVNKLKKQLNKGDFGEPFSVTIKRIGPFPNTNNVNVVYDLTSHDIDLLRYIFGKNPRFISSYGGKVHDNKCDYLTSVFKINNFYCYLESNWISPIKIRSISITGSKGYVEGDLIKQKLTLHKSKIVKNYKDYKNLINIYSKKSKIDYNIESKEPLELELKDFIHTDNDKNNLPDLIDSYNVLKKSQLIIDNLNK